MERIITPELEAELLKLQRLGEKRIAESPGPGFIADYVEMSRALLGWKQLALAHLAGVSLSTIQRVERGEQVARASIERIGTALGLEPGVLTEPRIPLTRPEFFEAMQEWIGTQKGRVPVKVKPLRGHSQVAKLLATHCILPESKTDRLSLSNLNRLVQTLGEVSFIRASQEPDSSIKVDGEPVKRRELYDMVLCEVRRLEKETNSIALSGTYEATTDVSVFSKATIGIIVFFDRIKDPGALKRNVVLAAERLSLRSELFS
jgi:transcriptional regulator with XRE-family HTH domain